MSSFRYDLLQPVQAKRLLKRLHAFQVALLTILLLLFLQLLGVDSGGDLRSNRSCLLTLVEVVQDDPEKQTVRYVSLVRDLQP